MPSTAGQDPEPKSSSAAQAHLPHSSHMDPVDETSSSGSSDSGTDSDHASLTDDVIPASSADPSTKPTDSSDIHNRLTSFFSQLAERRHQPSDPSADEIIEHASDSDSGYEEDDDNGRQYVELDLALGVLTENPDSGDENEVKLPGRTTSDANEDDEGSRDVNDLDDVLDGLRKVVGSTGKSKDKKKKKVEEVG